MDYQGSDRKQYPTYPNDLYYTAGIKYEDVDDSSSTEYKFRIYCNVKYELPSGYSGSYYYDWGYEGSIANLYDTDGTTVILDLAQNKPSGKTDNVYKNGYDLGWCSVEGCGYGYTDLITKPKLSTPYSITYTYKVRIGPSSPTSTATITVEIPAGLVTATPSSSGHGTAQVKKTSDSSYSSSPIQVEPGTSVTFNATADTGYHFKNWTGDKSSTNNPYTFNMDADTSLTANFEGNEWTVTFNANHGTVSPATKQVVFGSQYGNLPTPTRNNRTFQGWYLGDTLITNTSTVSTNANHELVARWNINGFVITANVNGGTFTDYHGWDYVSDTEVEKVLQEGDTYGDLPIATRPGYFFGGWSDSSGHIVTAETVCEDDATINARWQANSYTATFYNSDSSGDKQRPTTVVYRTNRELLAPVNLPQPRENYTFKGWKCTETDELESNWTVGSVFYNSQNHRKIADMTGMYGNVTFVGV